MSATAKARTGSAATNSPPVSSEAPGYGVTVVQQLLHSLARYDRNGRVPGQKLGFEIPERAVNEYLAYTLRKKPRPGIAAAKVSFGAGNQATLVADVDLGTIQEWNGQLIPEALLPMLHGRFSVTVTFRFEAQGGLLTFSVTDAKGPNGVTIPKQLVLDALQTIGLHQPESFETSKPIPLPFGLQRIWIDKMSLCGET